MVARYRRDLSVAAGSWMLAVVRVSMMSCGPDTSPLPWSTGRTLLLTPKVSQTVTRYPYGYYSAHMDTDTRRDMSNTDDMLRYYSAALDEIYHLRRALQFEARVVEAHYEDYKTFPKTRRAIAEEQVARMRTAATGKTERAYAGMNQQSLDASANEAMPDGLSRSRFEREVDAS
jgi:hypothetical protein